MSLKARALRYLSQREHSRVELMQKLKPHLEEGDDLEHLIAFLQGSNFLSDKRFSESLLNRRQTRFGNQKILAELHSHQMSEEDLSVIKINLRESELARANEVLLKKFPIAPVDYAGKAQCMRFLAQRGFTGRAIELAIELAWKPEG